MSTVPKISAASISSRIKNSNIAGILSGFKKPGAVLSVLCIELFSIAGRTREAYRRGGKVEARESILEESASGTVWLFGAIALNEAGDFIGKKMGVKNLDVDVGVDALRQPFGTIPKNEKNATAIFKFSKIFSSILISTVLLGFVIPKIKQNMTKKARNKELRQAYPSLKIPSMQDFMASLGKGKEKSLSFKGCVDKLLLISHLVENNNTARLIGTDSGMIAGRVVNSRNKAEAREFLFRDTASIYFYMFAIPNIIEILSKITNTVNVHPDAIIELQNYLKEKVGEKGMASGSFKTKALGEGTMSVLEKFPFDKKNKNVISLEIFNDIARANNLGETIAGKAAKMSELQPPRNGISIISKQQAKDILNIGDGWLSDPEFLKETISKATYGASNNEKKFVSRLNVEKIRESLDGFTEHIAKYAETKNNSRVTQELIDKLVKDNIKKSAAFTLLGMVFAILGIAILVPKLKNYITKVTTGEDSFPGVTEYKK